MSFKEIDTCIRKWNHKRIDYFRKIRLQFAKAIFDNRKYVIGDTQNFGRILVFRLDDKLGDCIVSTGFLRAIKEKYGESRIVVLSGPQTSEIYKNLPFVDEVLVCNKKIASLVRCYFNLKNFSYDFIVNTSHILSPRVVMLLSLLKAKNKIGFLNSNYNIFTDVAEYDEHHHHVLIRYRNLAALMDIHSANLDYVVPLSSRSVERVNAAVADLKKENKKIVLLNSFAGARLRNFSKELTFKIVSGLLKEDKLVVVSVANEGDHNIVDVWRREQAQISNWLEFKNFYTLDDNLALLSLADLVITPDTAWVHMAAALKKNLVAVYREDLSEEKNSLIWAPAQKNMKVVIAPSTDLNPNDINNVSPEIIIKEALSLLQ